MDKNQAGEIRTYEGIVEEGQIRLKGDVRLPEKTKVLVVIQDGNADRAPRAITPHLAKRSQAKDFRLEVTEVSPDAGV